MRALVMLIFLAVAVNCHAEDPLESLNTIEDTLAAMERTLNAQAWDYEKEEARDGFSEESYFVSYDPVEPAGWIRAWPCNLESAVSLLPELGACAAPDGGAGQGRSRFWKSRLPLSTDLQPGVLVLAQDVEHDGAWFLTKITDASAAGSGYVEVAAPFRAQVKGLRVVEE